MAKLLIVSNEVYAQLSSQPVAIITTQQELLNLEEDGLSRVSLENWLNTDFVITDYPDICIEPLSGYVLEGYRDAESAGEAVR